MRLNLIKYKIILMFAIQLFFFSLIEAQMVITPDEELNRKIADGIVNPIDILGVSSGKEGMEISPNIREGWTWFAAKNIEFKGKNLTFFFVNGRIYTNKNIRTDHRRIKLQKDVTDKINSNVFHIAFKSDKGKEKYINLFIYSEKGADAVIEIPKTLLGIEKQLSYYLKAGEKKFITIQKLPEESAPYYIPKLSGKRDTICLNQNWKFQKGDISNAVTKEFSDTDWETVSIPHCYNAVDIFDNRNVNDGLYIVPEYYRGPSWYRKTFKLDKKLKGRKLFIEFEGVSITAEVWVNGKFIGNHIGGYTGFKFDITDIIKFGTQNIIAVKVDNSYNYNIPPHSADYIMYGGIYRDARLIAVNPLMIADDIRITTPHVSRESASVNVKLNIENNFQDDQSFKIVSNIVNENDEIVSTKVVESSLPGNGIFSLEINHTEISNPELWSPSLPYLYNIVTTVFQDGELVDEVKLPLGFRWFSFDPDNGFFLNGKHLFLKGANKHQDYFKLGIAVPDSLQVNDIKLLKEMGSNFIRLAHYPQDPSVLKACDELGLIVWEEIPIVNSVGGEEYTKNAKNMIREMIHRDFNHPSVIMWGVTNESLMGFATEEATGKVYNLIDELNSLVKELDSSRVSVSVHNHMKDVTIADITDVIGRNRYYGWYTMPITLFKDEIEREHREHPNWVTIISEYGVGSKLGYHVENPVRFDFSEEYQLFYHEYYLKIITESPWISGALIWAGIDFGSFTKNGNIPKVNQKGVFDFRRKPKDLYYFYKSQWSDDPMVYIVSHTQSTRIGKNKEYKLVKVYSNCDNVELFVNGASQGSKEKQYVYEWNVIFNEGENSIKAVASNGIKTIEDNIKINYIIVEE